MQNRETMSILSLQVLLILDDRIQILLCQTGWVSSSIWIWHQPHHSSTTCPCYVSLPLASIILIHPSASAVNGFPFFTHSTISGIPQRTTNNTVFERVENERIYSLVILYNDFHQKKKRIKVYRSDVHHTFCVSVREEKRNYVDQKECNPLSIALTVSSID